MKTAELEFFSINSTRFLKTLKDYNMTLQVHEKLLMLDVNEEQKWIVAYPADISEATREIIQKIKLWWKKNTLALNRHYGIKLKINIKPDTKVSRQELESCSFVIYDTPKSKVFEQYLPTIPIKMDGKRITGGGCVYEGDDLLVSVTIPNPFNPQRFFTVLRSTSDFPLYNMAGVKISYINNYTISRISTCLEVAEGGCLEFNTKRHRIEFLWGDNHTDDNDWLCVESEHHVLCVRPNSCAQRDILRLIKIHEDSYEKIIGRLNIINKPDDKFLCYIHERTNKNIEGAFFSPDQFVYHVIYKGENREFNYAGLHELSHAIVAKYWGKRVPRLFYEGLAELIEWNLKKPAECHLAELLLSNALIPIKELMDDETFKKLCSSRLLKNSFLCVQC